MTSYMYDGDEVHLLAKNELLETRANEVRVKVFAEGVAFADILIREGVHPESVNHGRTPFIRG